MDKKLRRSINDRWLAGVCGGLAEYFGIPAIVFRLIFIIGSPGFVIYILLALLIPEN